MYMMHLNSDEFAKIVERIDMVIIPIGMTEAHGHHCPLGTDMLIPRKFLELLEERMGSEILIAPEIPYGHSWHLAPFPGTINISPAVFEEYVSQVASELVRWGLKKIVFFNGHGGNTPMLLQIMEKLTDRGVTSLLINWWQDFYQEILSVCEGQGHAGEDETSAVLAIDESLVDMSKAKINWNRATANVRFPGMQMQTMMHAQTGDATLASKEKGKAILRLCTEKIVDVLHDFQRGNLVIEDR